MSHNTNRKMKKAVYVIVIALIIITIPITILSHAKPAIIRVEQTRNHVLYTVRYDYLARVTPSIIYGYKDVVGTGYPLYMPLVRDITFNLTINVKSKYGIERINGKADVVVKLGEENGWNITLDNTSATINSSHTTIPIEINMTRIKSILNSVKEELNIPTGNYYVAIEPRIKIETWSKSQAHVSKILQPTLTLKIGSSRGKILIDELAYKDEYVDKYEEQSIQYISLLGLTVPVLTLRYISYILVVTSIGAAIAYTLIFRGKRELNVAEVLSKYGSYILKAKDVKLGTQIIKLKDFEELLRLSRILNKPIMYVEANNNHRFLVIDYNTVYVYEYSQQISKS